MYFDVLDLRSNPQTLKMVQTIRKPLGRAAALAIGSIMQPVGVAYAFWLIYLEK
jgi:hypothetical protein